MEGKGERKEKIKRKKWHKERVREGGRDNESGSRK